jgi:hypothetical protein
LRFIFRRKGVISHGSMVALKWRIGKGGLREQQQQPARSFKYKHLSDSPPPIRCRNSGL